MKGDDAPVKEEPLNIRTNTINKFHIQNIKITNENFQNGIQT